MKNEELTQELPCGRIISANKEAKCQRCHMCLFLYDEGEELQDGQKYGD